MEHNYEDRWKWSRSSDNLANETRIYDTNLMHHPLRRYGGSGESASGCHHDKNMEVQSLITMISHQLFEDIYAERIENIITMDESTNNAENIVCGVPPNSILYINRCKRKSKMKQVQSVDKFEISSFTNGTGNCNQNYRETFSVRYNPNEQSKNIISSIIPCASNCMISNHISKDSKRRQVRDLSSFHWKKCYNINRRYKSDNSMYFNFPTSGKNNCTENISITDDRCIKQGLTQMESTHEIQCKRSNKNCFIPDVQKDTENSQPIFPSFTFNNIIIVLLYIRILLLSISMFFIRSFTFMSTEACKIFKCKTGMHMRKYYNPMYVILLCIFLANNSSAIHVRRNSEADETDNTYMYGDISHPISITKNISVGLVLPHSVFAKRFYRQNIMTALKLFPTNFGNYSFSNNHVNQETFVLTPSPTENETFVINKHLTPTEILDTLCLKLLPQNVSAILYVTRDEAYGRNTASSQYFLQLAGYLGIPVIAWNADNSGLEQASQAGLMLQLAPSIHHQAHAMLSLLVQYQWHAFTIITTQIAGYTDFIDTILEKVNKFSDLTDTSTANFKFTIIDSITVERADEDLKRVKNSEARILLLYSTKKEGETIMKAAESLDLTGKNYVWIVTQSIIGENSESKMTFPVGMLGVHFETDMSAVYKGIVKTIRTFVFGMKSFLADPRNAHVDLVPSISCQGDADAKWEFGAHFYRYLKNVSIDHDNFIDDPDSKKGERPPVRFDEDSNRVDIELKIMNLRETTGGTDRAWEEIGIWRSWEIDGLYVNDIVWPGYKHVPPPGVPEKFDLKVTFMDEPPYISMTPPDSKTGICNANSGVRCFVSPIDPPPGSMNTTTTKNETAYFMCCSGFCIDLLKKFSKDLGFNYDLTQVEDKKWGTIEGTKWNGLVAVLMNQKADMALSSFKINSERENVIDFTMPFQESGISIVVAKRTGIISPTAFLEPFDTASWMLVAFVAIQVAALTIFLFEWLSPEGYNMKVAPPRDHKFSLLRTYWLVWAVLFQAAVHVDCPKGFTARFMANIWAMFAVVFLAIYTANLAAFMITREEYHDLSGVEDERLTNPFMSKPAFKFGTVPFTNSDSVFAKHLPEMYAYMSKYNSSHPSLGVLATKKGKLDAFLYDATVLDYLVGQDEECRLLTVGSWYHMTGYGVAFQRGSKHTNTFNKKLMEYKNNGDIERLQKFWLHGACRPKKAYKRASEPLALEQFLSAYLLLLSGVVLALLLLVLEHVYFKYLRKHLAKKDSGGCCALISLSMGKSLTFRGAVFEATDKLRRHRCRDPLCQSHMLKVKYELDRARLKIRQLEKELESHGVKPIRKYPTRGGNGSGLLSSCWRVPQEDMVASPQILNVFSSLSSGRSSGVGYSSSGGGDLGIATSIPPTPNITSARELLAIRDMTRNHITTNDPNRRPMYPMLSHQPSEISHLTSLSPTMVSKAGVGGEVEGNYAMPGVGGSLQHALPSTTSMTSLVYQDEDGGAAAYYQVSSTEGNYTAIGIPTTGTRHRSSVVDMREVAEMETVL